MVIGDSDCVTIDASQRWNDTHIDFVSGEEYDLRATGTWTDWYISSDADGFESPGFLQKVFESRRRAPRERWFCLMGSIGKNSRSLFRIGSGVHQVAKASGRLFCFANDVSSFYQNNKGSIQLTVKRTC
jgi:hypothetical protein